MSIVCQTRRALTVLLGHCIDSMFGVHAIRMCYVCGGVAACPRESVSVSFRRWMTVLHARLFFSSSRIAVLGVEPTLHPLKKEGFIWVRVMGTGQFLWPFKQQLRTTIMSINGYYLVILVLYWKIYWYNWLLILIIRNNAMSNCSQRPHHTYITHKIVIVWIIACLETKIYKYLCYAHY